jgi:hypothetical protein
MEAALIHFLPRLLCAGTPATVIILIARSAARRRSKEIEQLLVKVTQGEGLTWSAPVRYASLRRFSSWWKFFPWEGHGLLCVRQSELLFLGHSKARRDIRLTVPRGEVRLQWIGQDFWRNGALSWFTLSANEDSHCFTSDTGTWVFGSKRTTEHIFQQLSKITAT